MPSLTRPNSALVHAWTGVANHQFVSRAVAAVFERVLERPFLRRSKFIPREIARYQVLQAVGIHTALSEMARERRHHWGAIGARQPVLPGFTELASPTDGENEGDRKVE